MLLYIFLLILLATVRCGSLQLWSLERGSVLKLQRRMLEEEPSFRKHSFASLKSPKLFSAEPKQFLTIEEGYELVFDLPLIGSSNEVVTKKCTASEGSLTLPKASYESLDNFKVFTCFPTPLEELTLVVTDEVISGVFRDHASKNWFIDRAFEDDLETYLIYDSATLNYSESTIDSEDQGCEALEIEEENNILNARIDSPEDPVGQTNGNAYVFRFVTIVSPAFSSAATSGATTNIQNVAQEVTTILARANAVLAAELGVVFELIPGFQQAICLTASQNEVCDLIPEDHSDLTANAGFLNNLSFSDDQYDLGHRFVGTGGGTAFLTSLCQPDARFKSGGSSGGVSSFLLTFLHELGHMLSAGHSWRDCTRFGNQISEEHATEPGAGTTIMSYAGLCGEDNQLQTTSDLYYNSWSLSTMRSFIVARSERQNCGEIIDISREFSQLTTAQNATVPIGNYFQLVGESTTSDNVEHLFGWDRIDTGAENFALASLGRFKSYPATPRRSRFFPNLHFLNFEQDFTGEKLPEQEVSWNFRFIEKSKSPGDNVDTPSASVMGDFQYSDTEVTFVDVQKLSIESPARGANLSFSEPLSIVVDLGGVSEIKSDALVQIFFAVNTMDEVFNLGAFDYTEDVEDLNWIEVSSYDITGDSCTSQVTLSREELGLEEVDISTINGNFMVRIGVTGDGGFDTAGVYIFDIVTNVIFFEEGDVLNSVAAPSNSCQAQAIEDSRFWGFIILAGILGLGIVGYSKLRKPDQNANSSPLEDRSKNVSLNQTFKPGNVGHLRVPY